MVRPRGFEPLTYSFGGCRSIQLSYGREKAGIVRDVPDVLKVNRNATSKIRPGRQIIGTTSTIGRAAERGGRERTTQKRVKEGMPLSF
jgi:hypothetical protein